ncbi:MAG: Fur family transcriptional regulator [Dehalococcoidia bacterium]|jgi:Fur family peroxide stress response transcriptional regulator|nr:Fur family transcriptional regulator [Dehalococcoidia bacterium]|tara:strand:+ start:416 stop:877 length:462 start_codon:yes stop_codon:yes gene_type:complete
MLTQQQLVERMREWAVRVTPQRLAIAEVVLNSSDHPTVQQIYERVKGHFPSMTLATIYSTLGVLQKSGLVQELPFQKMSRYEPNMEPHVNLVCIECENVIDADTGNNVQDVVVGLGQQIANNSDFEVAWQRVDFYGLCPRCVEAKRRGEPSEV